MKNLETFLELLHLIEGKNNSKKDDFKEEIELEEGFYLPVEYHMKDGSNRKERDVFNVYLRTSDAQTHRNRLIKGQKFFLVVTESYLEPSGGELKSFPGKKEFGECVSLDLRKNQDLVQIKIINYGKNSIEM